MWHSRMLWRLFGSYGILLLSSISVLGMVIVARVEQQQLRLIEESLRTRAQLIAEAVHARSHDGPAPRQPWIRDLGQAIATRITLLDEAGRVLADSEEEPARMENHADRPEVRGARTGQVGTATRASSTLGRRMMYLALRTDRAAEGVAYVRVALPVERVQEQMAGLSRIVWTVVAGTGAAVMALAFWWARRVAQPIQELTHGAVRIAAGDYGHRVYAVGQEEVGTLARTFNHMSERLAAQFAQLEEDRQQLRTILSGMVEGVVALDAEQRILFANERAAQLLELPTSARPGRKLWEVVRRRALQDVVRRALAGSEPVQEELTWDGAASRSLTVHAATLPGAPPRGVVLVLHDTSELRRLERLRQEFVANVSHELKTPLSVMKVCVETLLDGAAEDPQHRTTFLEQIGEQADRLHNLILDLLSLARIESGAEAFDLEAVSLEPIVQACLERYRARAEAKQQRLEAVSSEPAVASRGEHLPLQPTVLGTKDPELSSAVAWADAEALSQILDNLVDNALKYTPAGGSICVRWQTDHDSVYLEVEDTGIGIPEQDLPRIFERFYRVDKARARELGGTGLGLSIVKHLAQAMHGSVSASSRVGQGTTFTVRLPRASAA
jgi:two-component system phosphate regulon sensor histidine kinase PhoR